MLGSRLLRPTRRAAAAVALPRAVPPAVARKESVLPPSLHDSVVPTRHLSTSSILCAQIPNAKLVETEQHCVTEIVDDSDKVNVIFDDKTSSSFPYVWLRENCQCKKCFNRDAIARLFLMEDLDINIQPKDVQMNDGGMTVEWPDGHLSSFAGTWLHRRAFTREARARQRSRHVIQKVSWGVEFQVPRVNYMDAMEDERCLLKWLVLLEQYGLVVTENSSTRVGAINDLIDQIGFIKPTHYGKDYELVTQPTPNNLAYTGAKLGLHTDLPYYEYPPGTTWLHCIQQHEGIGGENDLTDGLSAAEVLRQRHPIHFNTLVNTPIYFQDQGFHQYKFDKITKMSTIELDDQGRAKKINLSSQSRDSIMDLDADGVIQFYKALKAFNHILYEFSIQVKTQPGDILVVDNTRVLHGRQPFEPKERGSRRHLHNAYIDWDELRSKRRTLQEKLNADLS